MVGKKSVAEYARDQFLFNITISDAEKKVNREIIKTAGNKLCQVFGCCTASKRLQTDLVGKRWWAWKTSAKGLGSNVPSNMPYSPKENARKYEENSRQM